MSQNSPPILRRRLVAPLAWDRALKESMGWSKHIKTQAALARRSGVEQSTIGRILRGEVDPQSGNLRRLARAFGMSFATLARLAEDAELRAGAVITSEGAPNEELHAALVEVLVCWEDRRRGEQALEGIRRRENDAVERLQELLRVGGPKIAPLNPPPE